MFLTYFPYEGTGAGDFAVNANRKFLALLTIEGKTAYHLFDYKNLRMLKAARWKEEQQGNRVD